MPQKKEKLEQATFGAGCFWSVEEIFRNIKGVMETEVGYMGGKMKNPSYKDVCTDKTGHAEVVQIKFNPAVVSYKELLKVFWQNHDPTQLNRQGPDFGTQYRSVIFYYTPAQKKLVEKSKKYLWDSGKYKNKIVTAIEPASTFYRAEEYHQNYLMKRNLKVCP